LATAPAGTVRKDPAAS